MDKNNRGLTGPLPLEQTHLWLPSFTPHPIPHLELGGNQQHHIAQVKVMGWDPCTSEASFTEAMAESGLKLTKPIPFFLDTQEDYIASFH